MFFEKQAEYLIYSHNGKNWIYKVSGEPMNDIDLELLLLSKNDCFCGCHNLDNAVCGECYRKNCIRLRMKIRSQSLESGSGKQ